MTLWVCRAVGAFLFALGLWGFTASGSFLVFDVNPVHHIVQVVAGAAALWAGWSDEKTARAFSFSSAAAFGCVGLLGFMNVPAVVDMLGLNRADHWLHLLIGGTFLATVVRSRTALAADHAGREMRGISTAGGSTGM
jgi:hypothetical protein